MPRSRSSALALIALLLAVLSACGAADAADGTDPSRRPLDPTSAPWTDDGVPLHLYVSNQSFERPEVDIVVRIDGEVVVDEVFEVGNQHNWIEFDLVVGEGPHEVEVVSRSGEAELVETIDVPAERWMVIDYWSETQDGPGPGFTLYVDDEAVAFA